MRLTNPNPSERGVGAKYMRGFASKQTGSVGDMTAGLPPYDYGKHPYFEWYGENGRVVLELDPEQVEIIGAPLDVASQTPINRTEQARLMGAFMASMLNDAGLTPTAVEHTEMGFVAHVTPKGDNKISSSGEEEDEN